MEPAFQFFPLRVKVPNNWVLRALVIVIIVQVSGKYLIIRYLDPLGSYDDIGTAQQD